MLPTSTLERLAATRGIRFNPTSGEKRNALRLPLRATAHLHAVTHRLILEPIRVVLKDISLSGVGVLIPRSAKVPAEWVIWTGTQPATSGDSLALVCRTRRVSDAGPSLRLIGGIIEAMLSPGQMVVTGRLLPGYEWIPTLGDTPADPLAPATTPPAQVAVPLRPVDKGTGEGVAAA